MLVMHRGFQLVPFRDGKKWQAQIFSGGRSITTTMPFFCEELAMREAKAIVDGIRNCAGSAGLSRPPGEGTLARDATHGE